MKISRLDLKNDYEDIKKLFATYQQDAPSYHFSSPFGITARNDNNDLIGCFFLYLSFGVPTCLLRFPIISRTEVDKSSVFSEMMKECRVFLKELGYEYILCSTPHKGLINKLKQNDYKEEVSNCSHLVGVV